MFGLVLWAALPETRPAAPASDSADGGAVRAILRDRLFLAVCAAHAGILPGLLPSLRRVADRHACARDLDGWIRRPDGHQWHPDCRAAAVRGRGRAGTLAPLVLALASLVLGVGFGLNASLKRRRATQLPSSSGRSERFCLRRRRRRWSRISPRRTYAAAIKGRSPRCSPRAFAAAPAVGGYLIAHAGARWLWIGCFATCAAVAVGFYMLGRVGPQSHRHGDSTA